MTTDDFNYEEFDSLIKQLEIEVIARKKEKSNLSSENGLSAESTSPAMKKLYKLVEKYSSKMRKEGVSVEWPADNPPLNALLDNLKKNASQEKKKRGRIRPELSTEIEQVKLFTSLNGLWDIDSVLYAKYQPELREKILQEPIAKWKNLSNEELILEISNLYINNAVLRYEDSISRNAIKSYTEFVDETHQKRIGNSKKKSAGREKLYKDNVEILEDVFEQFSKSHKISQTTICYKNFEKLLFKLHPHPPFIPKPRIFEKDSLTAEQLSDELDDLKRDIWAPSTVRKFFNEKIALLNNDKK